MLVSVTLISWQVPAKGFLPPKDYAKQTTASINKKLPNIVKESKKDVLTSLDCNPAEDAARAAKRGLPEPKTSQQAREQGRLSTLHQIEEVLDNLNSSSAGFAAKSNNYGANLKENIVKMKTFAKPSTGIKGLVDMITEVIDGLEE